VTEHPLESVLGIDRLVGEVLAKALREFRARAKAEVPVWTDPSPGLTALLEGAAGSFPATAQDASDVIEFLVGEVMVRPTGNTDPRFWGWVHGGGDELEIVAAIIGAAMNANTGGRDHAAVRIEHVVLNWMREVFGFPATASAVFVQGTSEANLSALAVARTAATRMMDGDVTEPGRPSPHDEVLYVSRATHDSVAKAARLLQFGHLQVVGVLEGRTDRMDPDLLERAIEQDRAAGLTPVCIVGSAGTIDGGDCDDLQRLADVAARTGVWLHVDGAFGAWLRIAPQPFDAPVAGIERADSLATDLHKWLPVPFSAGILMVKDRGVHRRTFATAADYLSPSDALAGGPDWATNYGIALSRPFQGLAAYLVLRTRGFTQIGEGIAHCVVLASYFADLIERDTSLRLSRPTVGNVVLFEAVDDRGRTLDPEAIAADLQRRGETVFSTTSFAGRRVLRACFVNHRTRARHVESAVGELRDAAARLVGTPVDVSP
jgi:aromatic-L-amino-acid/L-tryptophan decarboxylase